MRGASAEAAATAAQTPPLYAFHGPSVFFCPCLWGSLKHGRGLGAQKRRDAARAPRPPAAAAVRSPALANSGRVHLSRADSRPPFSLSPPTSAYNKAGRRVGPHPICGEGGKKRGGAAGRAARGGKKGGRPARHPKRARCNGGPQARRRRRRRRQGRITGPLGPSMLPVEQATKGGGCREAPPSLGTPQAERPEGGCTPIDGQTPPRGGGASIQAKGRRHVG